MSGVRIRMAGGSVWTPHVRSREELRVKPHVARLNGMWALYYLLGKQTRIRCVLFERLSDVHLYRE